MPTYKIQNLEVTTPEVIQRVVEPFADTSVDTPTPSSAKGCVLGSGAEASILQRATPNMAVRVTTAGVAYNHLGQRIVAPTATSIAISAAHASNDRKDIVVLKPDGTYAVRVGTPAGSPTDPTLTAGDVPLARVTVTANATTITTSDITDLRSRKFIDGGKIIDKTVKAASTAMFVSTEQTGTGSSQNIAHGLGATPTVVLVALTNVSSVATITEGSHGSTNVVVTATSGAKYKVMAWL